MKTPTKRTIAIRLRRANDAIHELHKSNFTLGLNVRRAESRADEAEEWAQFLEQKLQNTMRLLPKAKRQTLDEILAEYRAHEVDA